MASKGYQFVHVECFARKADAKGRSVNFVLGEAERRPDACAHVAQPEAPQLIFGISLADLRALHDQRAETARTVIAGGKSRRIRADQLSLLTVVASHPATVMEVKESRAVAAEVAAWEARVVAWLREQWGEHVACVVRHTDEAHAHLHAYILPGDAELRARRLHPGVSAKEAAKAAAATGGADAKTANAQGDAAYRAAMRGFQDNFWRSVGIPCGLARLGPARRRLTRAEWHAEKAGVAAAAEALKVAHDAQGEAATARQDAARVIGAAEAERAAAEAVRARAEAAAQHAREAVQRARQQADAAKAAADAAEVRRIEALRHEQAASARARRLVAHARSEAGRVLAAAQASAARVQRQAGGIGAWLGALFHGLRGAAPASVARAAAEQARREERAVAAALVSRAQGEAVEARQELRRTEARLAAVSTSTAILGAQRDRLAQEVANLQPPPRPTGAPPSPRPH